MILRRCHGSIKGGLLSSNEISQSNPSNNHDDRGFLNMAISHLQNHPSERHDRNKQKDPSSMCITNAEINQPGDDEMLIESNVETGGPGNVRR